MTRINHPVRDEAPSSDPGACREVLLRVSGLSKSFGATQALRECRFDLRRGEVHAVMGENGSGKSTLVKILAGVHRPDSGSVYLGGSASPAALGSPRAAQQAGIATVFQEVLVVGPRSVAENVWLGTDGLWRHRRSRSQKRHLAHAVLGTLLDDVPDMDAPVEELSLSDRQTCCVARALVRQPRVLVLDEATSALDIETRRRLFDVVRRVTADGAGVIFISHRMDEVEEIADRVTVMRSGETVATTHRAETSSRELVALMTGTEHVDGAARPRVDRTADAPVVLRAQRVRLRPGAAPIDFELRAGEVVGLAGLEGHGQDTFLRALWGESPISGEVHCAGTETSVRLRSAYDAAAQGIAYVPRERRAEGIFEWLPIWQNFAVTTAAQDRSAGLLSARAARRRLDRYVERLNIRLGHPGDPISTLSGGNQQKVVIARWLSSQPRILLLNDPTRGVDLGAKHDIYALLEDLAREGIAVVMLSTEVDEHIRLMDRVLVFREDQLAAELPRSRLSRQALVASFFGEDHPDG